MRIKILFLSFWITIFAFQQEKLEAQDYYMTLDSVLISKSETIPALNERVSLSVSDVPLEEFLRGIANSSGLNLDIQPGLEYRVINNFTQVLVKDILIYVCRQFQLKIEVTGNIISLYKPVQDINATSQKVKWDATNGLVSFDFNNIPVEEAVREITLKTKANVILSPGSGGRTISVFIDSKPLKNALEKLAYSNSMILKQTDDNFFVLQPEPVQDQGSSNNQDRRTRRSGSERRNTSSGEFMLDIVYYNNDSIDITAENAPITSILNELSEKAGINYFLSSTVEESVTMKLKDVSMDEVFSRIFIGSKSGYRKTDGIFIIGEKNQFDFNEHRVIRLKNRSIDKLVDFIPADMTKDLTIKEFPELNSFFVTGTAYQINEFESFISQIDQVVPVVLIEVIIMYVNKTNAVTTGIQAGLGEAPATTGGSIFPGVDMTLGSGSINRIIDEMGWVNLGKVTPNFYISLKAMEEQGFVDLESTPKLSTLNGTEATLSIGNTEYYLEEQSNLYGAQNPQLTTSRTYKAVDAELKLKIKPVVSDNGQITMEIEVSQSDFTERISETAPPGTVNRNFTSKIRVKDQEMILLGGLSEKNKSDSGSGTPLLSRIPVIKWFFSSRKKENSNSKLSVLIKPTIIN